MSRKAGATELLNILLANEFENHLETKGIEVLKECLPLPSDPVSEQELN